jgi:predicted acylesterase/phospholipase RssA
MSHQKPKLRIVLGTGGIRILSAIGVLIELEKAGFQFSSAAGCSAGALIAALVSSGKNAEEIESLIVNTDLGVRAGKRASPWQRIWGPCAKYATVGLPSVVCTAIGGSPRLSDLPLPFEAVVVDLFNLDLQIYSSESSETKDTLLHRVLVDCVAVPGLYPTLVHNGKCLIDGAFGTQTTLALSQPYDPEEAVVVVTCHVPKVVKKPPNVQRLLERTIEVSIAINDTFILERLNQLGGLEYEVTTGGETVRRRLPYVHWINVECSPPVDYDQFDLDEIQKRQLIASGREYTRKYLSERGIQQIPISRTDRQSGKREAKAQEAIIIVMDQMRLHLTSDIRQGDVINMGDETNVISGGQQGSVGGRFNTLHDNTFTHIQNQVDTEIDLAALAAQLCQLRQTGLREAIEPEHTVSLGAIASAEIAAKEGNASTALKHLSTAGKWALDLANKIGAAVAAEALKKALGL